VSTRWTTPLLATALICCLGCSSSESPDTPTSTPEGEAAQAAPAAQASTEPAAVEPVAAAAVDAGDDATSDGRVTIGQVFSRRAELVGTEITILAEVVKYSAEIMGTNWLHLQDGTGSEGSDDLTVTTAASVTVGDSVVVRGVLVADRDFGYGYLYDLIIEDAQVTVQ